MTKITLKPGELLILKDDSAKDIFYVESGKFIAYTYGPDGKIPLGTINQGELVGEASLILGVKRAATVEAETAASVVCIPPEEFEKVLAAQHPWMKALVKTLVSRIQHMNEKLSSLDNP